MLFPGGNHLEYFVDLILLFFAYSLLGWCIEVTLKYFEFHRFINRGFFAGPLLPIYGSGAALITLVAGTLSAYESAYGTTFVLSFLICGTLEYLTSFFMESLFFTKGSTNEPIMAPIDPVIPITLKRLLSM